MATHILMNVLDEHELRVGVIRDGRLESLLHERLGEGQNLGNIYKARVANVEPSLDAAFLDLGSPKNGFIHVEELIHDKGRGARIENILKAGDEIIVQVTKEAIKEKGPCMSMYLSLPGRDLVMMHSEQAKGVSKRIEDPLVRKRLKKQLDGFTPPEGFGFIVRTHAEPMYDEARAFAQVFMPELCDKIKLHREELPLFTYYGLEERLAAIYDRKVELPSGGAIVIEQTEALVSIDVNSAKNRDSGDVETTALMTNLEAAASIAEQLVLRDLGGLIIIDFIDMEKRENQRLVQVALRRALGTDRAKIQVSPMSRFGLVEMTRQRQRPSHKLVASAECPYCAGTGSIKTAESFEIDVMRAIHEMLHSRSLTRLELVVPADLSVGILNNRRKELSALEDRTDCRIVVNADSLMKAREFRLNPTFRKGERRREEKHQPVRPSLLAPLMIEQAKAIKLAKELAAMKAEDLERELSADPVPGAVRTDPSEQPAALAPVVVQQVQITAPRKAAEVWEEAAILRRLLFSANTPVLVAPASVQPALASQPAPLINPPRNSNGRRRRQRR